VNLVDHPNYYDIDHQEKVPGNTRLIKHRTDEWLKERNMARVTGSTLYTSLGCDGLGKMKEHLIKSFAR
jgi:hypothetical protein